MFIGGANGRTKACGLAVAIVVGAASLLGVPGAAAGAVPAQAPAALPAVDVVILADESGSLEPADVDAEKDAANVIARNVLGPGSTVSIVGFGSENGPGQKPAETYCPNVVVDGSQPRDQLAGCIDRIHSRLPGEGNDTDQVEALRQAKALLEKSPNKAKVVFLLTDGKLDVRNSPRYGKDTTPDARQRTAEGQIPALRDELAKIKAQVWPLGFGQVPDGALDAYTTGTSCSQQEPNPKARVIGGPADLLAAVKQAFQSATCIKFGDDDGGDLPPGGSLILNVTIPPIASDASILVFKKNKDFTVSFQGPSKQQVTGPSGRDGAHYDYTGQQTGTEQLHIVEPAPGVWTIVVSSKPGSPGQAILATVAYQAAVNASIVVDPPEPAAGQQVQIDMSVQSRGTTITNPADLAPLTFVADLAGDGFDPPPPVTLADPDRDGKYSGTLSVPKDASGKLVFTGRVSGVGIGGDTRVANTGIQQGVPTLQGQITLQPAGATVAAGDTITGLVSVTNSGQSPARLQLQADDATPGLSLAATSVDAAVGQSTTPFELRVGPETAPGGAQVTLRLVDSAANKAVKDLLFTTEVTPVPSFLERYLWLWVALAALLALAVVVLLVLLARRRRGVAVGGLRAQLFKGGFPQHDLTPRNPRANAFRFVLQDDFHGVSLQHAGPSDPEAWVVTRVGGGISMTRTGDPRNPLVSSGEQREVAPDLAVAIFDERGSTLPPPPVHGSGGGFDDPSFLGGSPGGNGAGPMPAPSSGGGWNAGGGGRFDDPTVTSPAAQPPRPADEFASSYEDPFNDPRGSRGGGAGPNPTAPYPTQGSPYDPNNPF